MVRRRFNLGAFATWLLIAAACGDDASGPSPSMQPDAGSPPLAAGAPAPVEADAAAPTPEPTEPPTANDPDPAAALFAPDRLLQVEIELAAADWETLRGQGRSLLDIFGGDDCQAMPHARPFTYFEASVTVDGVRVEQAGVRKKGFFGSLSRDKPSLKVDFGEYVMGQTLDGVRRLTLNNAKQDASYLNQCVGYALFRDAGVPAPRCNFARVTVNGDYLGVYVNVEPIKKPFLRQHFADDGGNLYEGTLSDFRPGWTGTFERKTNDLSDPARDDINAVTTAIAATTDPLEALSPLIDLDGFYSFWAMEALVGHMDGYASNQNNFYVYADPGDGRFHFIPWGTDQLFDNGEEGGRGQTSVAPTQGAVAAALYEDPAGRARYVETVETLLREVWRSDERLSEVERMRRLISPHLAATELERFAAGVTRLEDFLGERPASARSMLQGLPEAATTPRDSICFETLGTISGNFDTVWNSLDNPAVDPRTFTGTLDPMVASLTYAPRTGGLATALSGIDGDSDDPAFDAAIITVIEQQDGSRVLLVLSTRRDRLAPGTLAIDFSSTRGILARQVGDTEPDLIGLLADGELVLEAAATNDGASVRGHFQATVHDAGFLMGR